MSVAVIDLVMNGVFTRIFRLRGGEEQDGRLGVRLSPSSASSYTAQHTTLLRLLTLGYLRSVPLTILSMRKNWAAKGRLYVLVGFVVTMMAVLWEVNVSVLYRGYDGKNGTGKLGVEGQSDQIRSMFELGEKKGSKAKVIYLVLVSCVPHTYCEI